MTALRETGTHQRRPASVCGPLSGTTRRIVWFGL
jgi:hypothetical protein